MNGTIDILLLLLFIVCVISFYKKVSIQTVESFAEGSCCMERFRAVSVMNKMLSDIDGKLDKIKELQDKNIKLSDVKEQMETRISKFKKSVDKSKKRFSDFKQGYFTYNPSAKEMFTG